MNTTPVGEWFVTDPAVDHAPVRVFCFPHAGGGPRTFLGWQHALGDAAQLLAAVPPGRGHRIGQPPPTGIDDYAESAARAVAEFADRPSVLLGHSLGALVAFEVARRLRGLGAVRDLVASGCAAPPRLPSVRVVEASRLRGRAFAEAVGFFGGLPPELVAAEELYDLVLPSLQADFALVAGYRYRSAAPLDLRVHLVNGVDDRHVSSDGLIGWAAECTAPPSQLDVAGGHFWFDQDPAAMIAMLRALAGRHQHMEVI